MATIGRARDGQPGGEIVAKVARPVPVLPEVSGDLGVPGGLGEASGQAATFGVGGGPLDRPLARLGRLVEPAESTEQVGSCCTRRARLR
jgi:hypothetical protein